LWIAGEGNPDTLIVIVFVTGVVLMRSAGCVINDYADRHIDKYVQRTSERPLTSGKISERGALILFCVIILAAFLLVLTLNSMTIMLALVGAVLAASYPFTKRYTHLPQIYLGAAFGWAIPMAFAAQTGSLDARLWWLFAATLVWAVVYDTMYAMVDRDDDIRIGVKSSAILFGKHDRLIIGLCQITMIVMLYIAGRSFALGAWFNLGLIVASLLAIYHQWLIRDRVPGHCFRAFLHNHWLGMAVFVGITADYALS
ncbi:MAG TPA: 4-hydroxybenzoate octaprenyltransferase, partial [Gammaproteobacteria bacterium]|nr:4-hydroxybenzoate octaprenyltransferase [Gammaproteobacteria bacterium]